MVSKYYIFSDRSSFSLKRLLNIYHDMIHIICECSIECRAGFFGKIFKSDDTYILFIKNSQPDYSGLGI